MTELDPASTVATLPFEEISGELTLALVSLNGYCIYSESSEDQNTSVSGIVRVVRGPIPLIGKCFVIHIGRTVSNEGQKKRSWTAYGPHSCSIHLYLSDCAFTFIGNLLAAKLLDENVEIEIPFFPKEPEPKKSWLPFSWLSLKRAHAKSSNLTFVSIDFFSITRSRSSTA